MKQILKADDLHQPFLFFHSLFIIPVILCAGFLQLGIIFIIYFGLNLIIKKKISILRLGLVSIAIIALNLSMPKGRILVRVFDFPITQTAFENGIYKALLFDCLILVSNFSLAQAIFLHGSIGLMIYNSLDFMNRLFQKIRNKSKNVSFYQFIDNTILNVWNDTQKKQSSDSCSLNFEFLLYFYIIIPLWIIFLVSSILTYQIK